MDRCRQYIADAGATWVIPSAGPPCFLDPELRDLNDDHGDPANIFPGRDGVPGADAVARPRRRTADDPRFGGGFHRAQLNSLTHPMPVDEVVRRSSPPARPTTSPPTRSGWRRCWRRRPAGRRRPASRCWNRCARCSSRSWCRATRSATVSAIPSSCGWVRRLSCWTSPNVLCANLFRMKFRYGFEIAPELVRTVLRDEGAGLGEHHLPVHPVPRVAGGRLQREYLYTFFASPTSGSPTPTAGSPDA